MTLNSLPIEIGAADLPLHCPTGHTASWNLHPRVYLDISHTGEAKCPYCGSLYRLKAGVKVGH